MGHREGGDSEHEERHKWGYLSFSKKDVGDDVRETAAQHQHHTLLAVCYARHLGMRDIDILCVVVKSGVCESTIKERVR